jgi:hypothetical protein
MGAYTRRAQGAHMKPPVPVAVFLELCDLKNTSLSPSYQFTQ